MFKSLFCHILTYIWYIYEKFQITKHGVGFFFNPDNFDALGVWGWSLYTRDELPVSTSFPWNNPSGGICWQWPDCSRAVCAIVPSIRLSSFWQLAGFRFCPSLDLKKPAVLVSGPGFCSLPVCEVRILLCAFPKREFLNLK